MAGSGKHRASSVHTPLPSVSAEEEYVVISGQTSVEALRMLQADLLAEHRDVPTVVQEVIARILKPETPVPVRQYAAGDAQAAQCMVDPLDLVDVARLFMTGVVLEILLMAGILR